MTTFQRQEKNEPIQSKVIGVQFGVMSPEEIIKHSVVEITSHETYERDEPVIKGLFDSRMGILDIGKVCSTCGLKNKECPGHFGHIKLARPVFYQQFLNYVLKILKYVCIRCSKILVDKNSKEVKRLLKKPEKIRFAEMTDLCSKIGRCGAAGEDNEGCGCKQPDKIMKGQGIINIFAEWKEGSLGNSVSGKKQQLYAEDVYKIFSRISDEDSHLMGLNPQWCRPENLICTVLPVPPPAVRPSVRESTGTQRMDDDLTHKLSDIIKSNKSLAQKMKDDASLEIIESWTKFLQWNIATMIDNDIPGMPQACHRSQRPIKSIIQRLKGKEGRIRSNLMGKRVDFSARSVITPDPNISIDELGVPYSIAMNLTFPEKVTKYNMDECKRVILNGTSKYPGVNSIVYSNSNRVIHLFDWINIDLKEIADKLSVGDVINRHLIDGDIVLFNRQPSLHRMSMMGHKVKVMDGSTFRLNISVTTPYNADFDGDEMNMHVPQSISSRYEIENLALVPTQIISPRTNKPIIYIVQDTLLGINKLTKYSDIEVRENQINQYGKRTITDSPKKRMKNCYFTLDNVMNIMARISVPNFDIDDLKNDPKLKPERTVAQGYKRDMWSGLQIFSLIIPKNKEQTLDVTMGNSLNTKEKDGDTVVKIIDSVLESGTLDKKIFNTTSKGLIHTIYNKFGMDECHRFLDNLQRIVTQFLIIEGFSVGISDLVITEEVNENIKKSIDGKITEVNKLIKEIHFGIFEAPPGKTTRDYLETKINNILNKANNEAGKIAGDEVNENNRVINMINAGSKGNKINIGQMMACLGQQNVDGKRIPYGFENRTLPHFRKCDDGADARGFVSSSFIDGLTPQEYFFHAMGGREGLIDTAVKTSDTGYIQRKLIKAMEDLKVYYDYSVRSNNNNIVQFIYGDDAFDAIKIEEIKLDIIDWQDKKIETEYKIDTKQGREMLKRIKYYKEYLFKKVFKMNNIKNKVFSPVHFTRIIKDVQKNYKGSVAPGKLFDMLENTKEQCFLSEKYSVMDPENPYIFQILLDIYLHPRKLAGINEEGCKYIHDKVVRIYLDAIINPGEMVGPIAAQSIGEPATQMTLNTFHYAGVSSKSNVTRGIPRLKELMNVTPNLKNPSTTIYLKDKYAQNENMTKAVLNKLEYTKLKDIVNYTTILYDPKGAELDPDTNVKEDIDLIKIYKEFEELEDNEHCEEDVTVGYLPWILRMEFNSQKIMDKGLLMADIISSIREWSQSGGEDDGSIKCIFSDDNSENLIARINIKDMAEEKVGVQDQSDIISGLKEYENALLNEVVIKGIPNITNIIQDNKNTDFIEHNGNYICKNSGEYHCTEDGNQGEGKKIDNYVLETDGVNLQEVLCNNYVDFTKTFSNDILEMQDVLGVEAARNVLLQEIFAVVDDAGEYVNFRHLQLLVDLMTSRGAIMPVNRQGINKGDNGPLAKMSFEDTTDQIMKAGIFGDCDNLKGVSANIMMGQVVPCGTGNFEVLLDEEVINEYSKKDIQSINEDINMESILDGDDDDDYCNDDDLDFSFAVE